MYTCTVLCTVQSNTIDNTVVQYYTVHTCTCTVLYIHVYMYTCTVLCTVQSNTIDNTVVQYYTVHTCTCTVHICIHVYMYSAVCCTK